VSSRVRLLPVAAPCRRATRGQMGASHQAKSVALQVPQSSVRARHHSLLPFLCFSTVCTPPFCTDAHVHPRGRPLCFLPNPGEHTCTCSRALMSEGHRCSTQPRRLDCVCTRASVLPPHSALAVVTEPLALARAQPHQAVALLPLHVSLALSSRARVRAHTRAHTTLPVRATPASPP
jgi:hypothetical protein